MTLHPGKTCFEGQDDVHIVGRNASKTKLAKFIALLTKDTGAPMVMPAQ